MKLLKWFANFTIIAVIMFVFAYCFLDAWDRQEYIDQARRANKQVERGFP